QRVLAAVPVRPPPCGGGQEPATVGLAGAETEAGRVPRKRRPFPHPEKNRRRAVRAGGRSGRAASGAADPDVPAPGRSLPAPAGGGGTVLPHRTLIRLRSACTAPDLTHPAPFFCSGMKGEGRMKA